jgi:hypothetical protein
LLPNTDRPRANLLPEKENSRGQEDSIERHLSMSAQLMKGRAMMSQEGNHLRDRHFEILAKQRCNRDLNYFPNGKLKLRPVQTGIVPNKKPVMNAREAGVTAASEYFNNKMRFANHVSHVFGGKPGADQNRMDCIGMLDLERKRELLPTVVEKKLVKEVTPYPMTRFV